MNWRIYSGDCVEVLKGLQTDSLDACVTDPPYGLEFMGKEWDRLGAPEGFRRRKNTADVGRDNAFGRMSARAPEYAAGAQMQIWHETWVREVLRVLKPGGYLLAFGGTRTYHRLACAVEDAGFEIRDSIDWIYGSGFPKSLNLGDGRGTAIKPAHEPIVVARKPLIGTVAKNVLAHGTGALNIDACRIGPSGRWPANIVLDAAAGAELDAQSGPTGQLGPQLDGDEPSAAEMGHVTGLRKRVAQRTRHMDSGGASRFFYCPKASKADRGLDNNHPTVKPTDLMRWLIRLVTPPGGTVLDPFVGSGTTLVAAKLEGFAGIGIEREAAYVKIAKRRLAATRR